VQTLWGAYSAHPRLGVDSTAASGHTGGGASPATVSLLRQCDEGPLGFKARDVRWAGYQGNAAWLPAARSE
jgi:hypothetical protein